MEPTSLDSEQIDAHTAVLKTSREQEALASSAKALASSSDPAALMVLERFLQDPAFLARLDVLSEPQLKLTNLRHVLAALQVNPTAVTGRLCEALADHPGFLADPDRKMFLLPVLAAVRPMTEAAEHIFRAANDEGYFNLDGPLLVANGSPRALGLFEEMVADVRVAADDRVDMIRKAVLAHRLDAAVLAACVRVIDRGLEPEVERGLIETLFDYQEKEWFGVARFAPTPPAWSVAETEVLQSYLQIGHRLTESGRLDQSLRAVVERTKRELSEILASRWS
jgi:hypothetical protein